MISDSEREDFEKTIRANGFELDDFELVEERDLPNDGKIYIISGRVTIKRKSNGVKKSYRAGHESTWPAEFSDDLSNGVYSTAVS